MISLFSGKIGFRWNHRIRIALLEKPDSHLIFNEYPNVRKPASKIKSRRQRIERTKRKV